MAKNLVVGLEVFLRLGVSILFPPKTTLAGIPQSVPACAWIILQHRQGKLHSAFRQSGCQTFVLQL